MAYRRATKHALASGTLRGGACAARHLGHRERREPRADSDHSPQARARTRGVTGKHATATRSYATCRAPRRRRRAHRGRRKRCLLSATEC